MTAVFADTYCFLALVSRKDKAHRRCVEFSENSDLPVITTTWVLMEVGDSLRRGRDRPFSRCYSAIWRKTLKGRFCPRVRKCLTQGSRFSTPGRTRSGRSQIAHRSS